LEEQNEYRHLAPEIEIDCPKCGQRCRKGDEDFENDFYKCGDCGTEFQAHIKISWLK